MKKIANMVKDIKGEIEGADHYGKMALQYKTDDKPLSDVYSALASQELEHVTKLHDSIIRVINEYRAKNGDPPAPMMAVWNWEHEEMVERVTKVKSLLEMVKK